jgi:hypothetical protein
MTLLPHLAARFHRHVFFRSSPRCAAILLLPAPASAPPRSVSTHPAPPCVASRRVRSCSYCPLHGTPFCSSTSSLGQRLFYLPMMPGQCSFSRSTSFGDLAALGCPSPLEAFLPSRPPGAVAGWFWPRPLGAGLLNLTYHVCFRPLRCCLLSVACLEPLLVPDYLATASPSGLLVPLHLIVLKKVGAAGAITCR